MSSEGHERISVSRDALRADLAEMELRLRVYFDDQLRGKADVAQVVTLSSHMVDLRRGEFTDAHRRAIVDLIEETVTDRADRGWTTRERFFGVIAIVLAIASFFLTMYMSASARGAQSGSAAAALVERGSHGGTV